MAFFSSPRPISPSPPLLLTKCRPFFKSQITRVPASPTLLCHRIPPPPAAARELEAVEDDEKFPTPLLEEESDVAASVEVLKAAAKTRKVPPAQVLAALASIKKGKAEPSSFLETLGGTESPGRTWMLIFTAQGKLDEGRYFPITAVQRFDAAAKRIENGVFFGPVGSLTFEGKFSWKNRILAFIFQTIRIKLGPFGPLQIDLGQTEREPTSKDPFFIWFYIDEEIAVAQGRGGGIAYWCRCRRVT